MRVPARLKWVAERGRFAAYPTGLANRERAAIVTFGGVFGQGTAIGPMPTWHWSVTWPGWFAASGNTDDKQSAADKATEEWWRLITTPLPRDVDTEIDIIVARILVMPPPNSVLAEDMAFLQRLNRLLFKQFENEIKAGISPPPVSNLLANLSAELYRRRLAGDSEPRSAEKWGAT